MEKRLKGQPVVAGYAQGSAIILREPISFWGGIDPSSGEIIDRRVERSGQIVAGKVFVFPNGKGSSTGSAVLMESIHNGTAPAAIINVKVDSILALGSIVAEELYQRTIPIIVLPFSQFNDIAEDDLVTVFPDGTVLINHAG